MLAKNLKKTCVLESFNDHLDDHGSGSFHLYGWISVQEARQTVGDLCDVKGQGIVHELACLAEIGQTAGANKLVRITRACQKGIEEKGCILRHKFIIVAYGFC